MTIENKSNVSVVMPTYNGEKYIKDSIRSISNQTTLPREIIVVDDCSSDATVSIVDSIKPYVPCPLSIIRLVKNSGGPAHPLNIGVQACAGEYIAFLDQDDIMHPEKVDRVEMAFAIDQGIGLVFGQWNIINNEGVIQRSNEDLFSVYPQVEGAISPAESLRIILEHGYRYGGAGGTAIRKSAWQAINGFNENNSICWDLDIAIKLAVNDWPVYYVPSVFYSHRVHDSNFEKSEGGIRGYCEGTTIMVTIYSNNINKIYKDMLRDAICKRVNGAGYWERERGNYQQALRNHWFSVRHRNKPFESLLEIGKDIIHCALSPIRSDSSRACRKVK